MINENSEKQFTGYIPEMWNMRKDNIYAASLAISIGLQYIEDVIEKVSSSNDLQTSKKMKLLEIINKEKLICEEALKGLKKPEYEN
jgi:hypothetical protein